MPDPVVVIKVASTRYRVFRRRGISATSSVAIPTLGRTSCAPATCSNALQDFQIHYVVEGQSLITWELSKSFVGRSPLVFQLQVGDTGNPSAEDWRNVGDPVTDVYQAIDPTKRTYGKQLTCYYRLLITDIDDRLVYTQPQAALGSLSGRDAHLADLILQKERLRLRNMAGVRGYLVKRKRSGAACPKCLDEHTGESLNSRCDRCFGTRFDGGYYRALPCQLVETSPQAFEEDASDGPAGWDMQMVQQGRFVGSPLLSSGDMWINAQNDLRYHIRTVQVLAQIRTTPIVQGAQLLQLPFSHPFYRFKSGVER